MGWKSKEAKLEYDRKWRDANREHVRTQGREYARKRREADPAYGRTASLKYWESHRDQTNAKQRLKRTGCTPEQYAQALIDQNNLCLICSLPFVGNKGLLMPCADHDHATMVFRGLLHQKCNRGLGHFNDDIRLLANAIEYLNKHK
jgi:recombination endonuclease VII